MQNDALYTSPLNPWHISICVLSQYQDKNHRFPQLSRNAFPWFTLVEKIVCARRLNNVEISIAASSFCLLPTIFLYREEKRPPRWSWNFVQAFFPRLKSRFCELFRDLFVAMLFTSTPDDRRWSKCLLRMDVRASPIKLTKCIYWYLFSARHLSSFFGPWISSAKVRSRDSPSSVRDFYSLYL